MNESELLKLADLNLIEFWRESAKWIPGTEIVEKNEAVFIDSGNSFPGCSLVFNLSEKADGQPAGFMDRATAFFRGRKKGFSLMLRGHKDQEIIKYCKEQNVFLVGEQPGMVLDNKIDGADIPAGAELRWVSDAAGLQDFKDIVAEAYLDLAFPREVSESYFTHVDRVLSPFSVLAVVYLNGEPSCAAMTMLSHGIAGVYWVGTRKQARARGLAQYCVRRVSNVAFEMGARKVVLQASKFGAPIYPKIGYRTFTTYPHFVCIIK
jgi:hypothetical protein